MIAIKDKVVVILRNIAAEELAMWAAESLFLG